MSEDLIVFLRARLDEYEALATSAIQAGETRYGEGYHRQVQFDPGGVNADDGWLVVDPAQMLREVEAKRAILAEYKRVQQSVAAYPNAANAASLVTAQTFVRLLTLPFSDQPDYRQEWAP
jgi:hypothetical protein